MSTHASEKIFTISNVKRDESMNQNKDNIKLGLTTWDTIDFADYYPKLDLVQILASSASAYAKFQLNTWVSLILN